MEQPIESRKRRAAERMTRKRQDTKIRLCEIERRRRKREDSEIRTPKKIRDADRRRRQRENPDFRILEQRKDTNRRRKAREDPRYRAAEQLRNTEQHRRAREKERLRRAMENPVRRTAELKRNHPCHCCDRLYFKRFMYVIKLSSIQELKFPLDVGESFAIPKSEVAEFCSTCYSAIFSQQH